jgi:hypothetical protein
LFLHDTNKTPDKAVALKFKIGDLFQNNPMDADILPPAHADAKRLIKTAYGEMRNLFKAAARAQMKNDVIRRSAKGSELHDSPLRCYRALKAQKTRQADEDYNLDVANHKSGYQSHHDTIYKSNRVENWCYAMNSDIG